MSLIASSNELALVNAPLQSAKPAPVISRSLATSFALNSMDLIAPQTKIFRRIRQRPCLAAEHIGGHYTTTHVVPDRTCAAWHRNARHFPCRAPWEPATPIPYCIVRVCVLATPELRRSPRQTARALYPLPRLQW